MKQIAHEQDGDPRSNQRLGRCLRQGFTILELLVVLAILGIIFGIGASVFTGLNRQVGLESAVSELSQSLLESRNKALTSGNRHRVEVSATGSYSLDEEVGGSWVAVKTVDLPPRVTLVAPLTDSVVVFDTRGFADFTPDAVVYQLSDGDHTLSIAPSMSGTTRIR